MVQTSSGPGIYELAAGAELVVKFCPGTIVDVQWNGPLQLGWAQDTSSSNTVVFLGTTAPDYLLRPLKVPPQAIGLYLFRPVMAGSTRVAIEVM